MFAVDYDYSLRLETSVYLLVCLISAHIADGILQHGVLLVEVVHGFLALGEVVHRTLEEEAQETLYAVTAGAGSKVAEQTQVEKQWSSEDGVAAEEVYLYLHGVTHPSENVDVVPSFLIVVAWRIVVYAHLVIIVGVEIRLFLRFEDCLES